MGLGTQVLGSILRPASFCGVVGFRPSPGMVAVERRAMGWTPISVLGPMGRSVADLCLLYATQIGHHDSDPLSFPLDPMAYAEPWPVDRADAVICINMIHIAPWSAAVGLMRGAARLLAPGSVLFLYGPYHRDGRPTSPGNEAFDQSLRQQNAAWGIRDLEDVTALGEREGFTFDRAVDMPANNLSVVFRRR